MGEEKRGRSSLFGKLFYFEKGERGKEEKGREEIRTNRGYNSVTITTSSGIFVLLTENLFPKGGDEVG